MIIKEEQYLEILHNFYDGIYFVDISRRVIFWNRSAEKITGYTADEVVNKPCFEVDLNHIDHEGRPLCEIGCPLHATILDGKNRRTEVFIRHKEGHRIPVYMNVFPILDGNEIVGAAEIFAPSSPIAYDNKLIESLTHSAMNDRLTGIANRHKLEWYLEYKLTDFKRYHNLFCLVFFDIDEFRNFNNVFGHEAGDDVLKTMTMTIQNTIRKTDLFGRWGGDEFIGIFEVNSAEEAYLIAEKLRVLVANTPVYHKDKVFNVTISIGVTLVNVNDNKESVVNRADLLMYQSKQNGHNRVTADAQQ